MWAGWDYLGEAGAGAPIYAANDQNLPVFGNGLYPWFQDFQGDIDLIGQRKPQNYWRSVVYGSSPLELLVERPAPAGTQQFANNWSYYDELRSWTWDVPEGQDMTVHAYTTGDSVTLLLNGSPVATNPVTAADKRVSTFTVPYAPGELTAVASRNGQEIGQQTLRTTGAPAALRASATRQLLTTGRDDLAHVLVEVLDGHGRRVPDAVVRSPSSHRRRRTGRRGQRQPPQHRQLQTLRSLHLARPSTRHPATGKDTRAAHAHRHRTGPAASHREPAGAGRTRRVRHIS